MTDLDLIYQLGNLLGRPLQEISEERFEQYGRSQYKQGRTEEHISCVIRDIYSLAADGTLSGLLLQPITSELLHDFPLQQFR